MMRLHRYSFVAFSLHYGQWLPVHIASKPNIFSTLLQKVLVP